MRIIACFFLISVFSNGAFSIQEDYYWRDFDGHVPEDAVVGGQSFGHNVYIGQAYIRNQGVFPVMINPGVREVAVSIHGVKRVDKYTKILCGPKSHFEWIPSNSTSLHYDLLDTHAVLGGHEDGCGYIYIGRIQNGKSTQIGKVNGFEIGDSKFYYSESNSEKYVPEFEVLCFANYGGGVDVRLGRTKH